MAKYRIAWLPGDGVGVDVMEATKVVLDKSGFSDKAEYIHGDIGWEFWCSEGDALPQRTLDIHRLRIWLQFVGQRRTWELMRLKGIVRCRDHGPRVVIQGIYQWMELRPEMGEAPDESLLVLIGRDLDHVELRRGWEAVTGGP